MAWMCWVTNVATPLWAWIPLIIQLFTSRRVWLYFCVLKAGWYWLWDIFRSTAWHGSQEHDVQQCGQSANMLRTCYEYVPRQSCIAAERTKIVGFQDEHKGIPCRTMLVWPSRGGSLCHKHFFSNSRTSCLWLPRRLCCRTRSIVCTGL